MTKKSNKPDHVAAEHKGDPEAAAAKNLATEAPVKQMDNMGAAIDTAAKTKAKRMDDDSPPADRKGEES